MLAQWRSPSWITISTCFTSLLTEGQVETCGQLAQVAQLSPARLTQILALCHLAPVIQERVLFLEVVPGREWITEKRLRDIARLEDWQCQQAQFEELWQASGRRD